MRCPRSSAGRGAQGAGRSRESLRPADALRRLVIEREVGSVNARVARHDVRLKRLDQVDLAQAHQAEAALAESRHHDGLSGAFVAHHRPPPWGRTSNGPWLLTVQEPSAREGGSGALMRLGGRHRRLAEGTVRTTLRSTRHSLDDLAIAEKGRPERLGGSLRAHWGDTALTCRSRHVPPAGPPWGSMADRAPTVLGDAPTPH